jgi:macrolide-specific efflux system membrane fusion protein
VIVVAGLIVWRVAARGDGSTTTTATAQVTSGTVKQTVSASGTLEPAKTADLGFTVSGTVTHVYVKAGDKVTKGQALAAVGNTSLVAARTAAQASYDAAVAQYDQDGADGASAVQLAADQTSVVSAKASLASAQQDVESAVLRSTIKGTVTSLDLAVGDVVGSGGGVGGGSGTSGTSTSAVTIASTSTFVVDGTVSADDASSVKKGMQAEVTVSGVSDTIYGTVESVGLIAQTSNSGSAVFPVTIAVTGKQTGLYAGTSATVSIVVKQRTDVITVSSRALQTDGDETYVEKIVDGKTVKTDVTLGEVYGATTEVTSGLAEGDEVQIPGFTLPSGGGGTGNGNGGGFFGGDGGGGFPAGGGFPGGGGNFTPPTGGGFGSFPGGN